MLLRDINLLLICFRRLVDRYNAAVGRARSKDAARRAPARPAARQPSVREPRRALSIDARPYSPQVYPTATLLLLRSATHP